MLDDINVLAKRDSEATLDSCVQQPDQTQLDVTIQAADHDGRELMQIVFVGMGGSGLAAEFVQTWLGDGIGLPIEVVKSYKLPGYVGKQTLVIVSSCSGNTEEVLEALEAAKEKGAQLAVITAGGKLAEKSQAENFCHVILPPIKIQPRMLTFIQVRAILSLLGLFSLLESQKYLDEIASAHDWLQEHSQTWRKEVPLADNYAKQLALLSVGKTAVFFGGDITWSLAYKWKISWNENAKNTAFWNQYPEFNHNEFIGWSSHPVEKPFIIFDLVSHLEHPRILKRYEISDKLLSGKRPKANMIQLKGEAVVRQLLWGHLLADYTSIYLGILNNVDPGPVPLVTKLKQELEKV